MTMYKVQKATTGTPRAAREDTTTTTTSTYPTSSKSGSLYFGYGSNLSTTQMQSRCPSSATPLAIASLPSWAWFICNRGYANVIPVTPRDVSHDNPASVVWGLIYRLTPPDEGKLDGYEGWNASRAGEVNPVPSERKWKPRLQGECSYNKLYLLVKVKKWLVDEEARKGVWGVQTESECGRGVGASAGAVLGGIGSGGKSDDLIRTLVYVDEVRVSPGRINDEYIGRMSRAVAESVPLGIPESWVDGVMRAHGIVWWNVEGKKDVSGEGAKVVRRRPNREDWEMLREELLLRGTDR